MGHALETRSDLYMRLITDIPLSFLCFSLTVYSSESGSRFSPE